jgi:hypothetical protein
LKPSLITVDPAKDPFEALNQPPPVMAEREPDFPDGGDPGPDRLTPEDRQKVESALPRQATAKPRKARKLLVMDLNVCYPGHRSITSTGLELMSRNTSVKRCSAQPGQSEVREHPPVRAVFLNNTVG